MNLSQPAAPSSPTEFAAFVGIDWADQKHAWALQIAGVARPQCGEMEHTPEVIDQWAGELARQFGGRPVAVALEQSRGALLFSLTKYPHLVLFPVHPGALAHYRRSFRPSGAKDDPHDAVLLLDLLLCHRDRLRRLDPDTVETRTLQFLVEERRNLVNQRTRLSNRLTAQLKLFFPQILDWFDDVTSPLVGALLERWPTLEELQGAHDGTLRKFFHQQNCRSAERIQERIDAIRQAVPATTDTAVLGGEAIAADCFLAVIATLRTKIAELDKQIAEAFTAHPEKALFDSLPGAGPAMAPRLLVAFGTDRQRFANADEIQRYSGIAPVTVASGQSKWVHFRWACPKFLRQTFHEFAGHSLAKCQWAHAYYDLHIHNGNSHHAAVRALAFKWIRILFRCWKDGKPYDEQVYLQSLQKRNSPLKALLPSATGLGWKNVAGFQKFSDNLS